MARRFGVILTICFGILLVVIGLIVLMLYLLPNTSIGGIRSVYMKNQFTNYYGAEIAQIFDPLRRNIIIESDNTPVTIRIRSDGQGDENSVTVFEDANGITFNSVNSTRLNFMQEYGDDDLVYTRISVVAPKGAVIRDARIYINLKDENSGHGYNFILRTGKAVSFEADAPSQVIIINKMVVEGSGHVAAPAAVVGKNSVIMKVGELIINGNNTSVNCRADISRDVTINGTSRGIELGNVMGNVNIDGNSHYVSMGDVSGSVKHTGTYGSLKAKTIGGNLNVTGEQIDVNVGQVVNNMINNRYGNVSIDSVLGYSDIRMETGNLRLGTSSTNKAHGNVIVNGDSDNPKRSGSTSVYFAETSLGVFRTFAVDGNVSVYGARKHVYIEVAAYGTANVNVEFADVLDGTTMDKANKIIVHGSRELNKKGGNVVVKLGKASTSFLLHLENTFEIKNELVFPNILWYNTITTKNGQQIVEVPYQVGSGGNFVWVKTHASVRIIK